MNQKNKSDNRKALPKFLLSLVIAMALGFGSVMVLSLLRRSISPEALAETLRQGLKTAAPWALWAAALVMGGAALLLYRKSKRLFSGWDGEDEGLMERAEEKLSWALWLVSLLMIVSFFLFGAAQMLNTGDDFDDGQFLLAVVGFLVSIALTTVLQQKIVDLLRKMNPEKQGSVYDAKFRSKWLNSCDENEQRKIGKAAMKAFTALNYLCVGLWLVLTVLNMLWPVGVLPLFLVMLIWGVCQTVYCLEAIRLEKRG